MLLHHLLTNDSEKKKSGLLEFVQSLDDNERVQDYITIIQLSESDNTLDIIINLFVTEIQRNHIQRMNTTQSLHIQHLNEEQQEQQEAEELLSLV